MDKAVRDAASILQGDVAHYNLTVRERLEQLTGQSDAQGGRSGSQSGPSAQDGPPAWSVDPDYPLLESVLVRM